MTSFKLTKLIAFSLIFIASQGYSDLVLLEDGMPEFDIVLGADGPSEVESFAADELAYSFRMMSGSAPRIISEDDPFGNPRLVIGTPHSCRAVRESSILAELAAMKSDEGYIVKIDSSGGVIGSFSERGVLYGVLAFIEHLISHLTGFPVADLDFRIPKTSELVIGNAVLKSQPYYPVRATLGNENPNWLARHRINSSFGEGVWTGTGIDDGLASAFKYVTDSRFDRYQDESWETRWARKVELVKRFEELRRRGIEPYLFVYVMGEPTKALIREHPEFKGESLPEDHPDESIPYTPLCWSNPDLRKLLRELVIEIVSSYKDLAGIHLRAWGSETRPCRCPDCLGHETELIWEIIFDLMDAARSVRNDIKFCISGYEAKWLKDPNGRYLSKMPAGTVVLRKWGYDGEPTDDPLIPEELATRFGNGKSLVIISHDVEEVMPLWMIESHLFATGVRRYLDPPFKNKIGGYVIQGSIGLGNIDKMVSARINWDPWLDVDSLISGFLISKYGEDAAPLILDGLRTQEFMLSDYFRDFAGTVSITGRYGNGSAWFATRLWNLIGKDRVVDVLSIPTRDQVEYADDRLIALIPSAQKGVNQISAGIQASSSVDWYDRLDLDDALRIARFWSDFLLCRRHLVLAVKSGMNGDGIGEIRANIDAAAEFSESMKLDISQIQRFVDLFGYSNDYSRDSLVSELDGEIAYMRDFDASTLIVPNQDQEKPDSLRLEIESVMSVPNPTGGSTTFVWVLSTDADECEIKLFTTSGRLVGTYGHLESHRGYNEYQTEINLPNGIYIYLVTARRGDEKADRVGKLAVVK